MKNNNPIVSVIIPTFNRSNLLIAAINSVINQTFSDFELIVIDDASADNTKKKVASINDKRIKYLSHSKNSGVCAARNTGLKAAQGQYIAFLDSDDEWLPNKLEKQLALFKNSPENVGVIYSWLQVINEQGHIIRIRKPDIRGDVNESLIYNNIIGTPSTVMIRAICFEPHLMFDKSLRCCEDWDLWLQISKNYKFEVISEPLALYRDHHEDKRGSTNHATVVEGHLAFIHKNHQDIEAIYRKPSNLDTKLKSLYLFQIGRRLICHGQEIAQVNAIKSGRKYLYLAASAQSSNIYLWIHYLAACCGGVFYTSSIQVENRFRAAVSSTLKRLSFSFKLQT